MASYISQASQMVKTHLQKHGRYKQQRQPVQPDISDWLEAPKKTLLEAWKKRWQENMATKQTALQAADYPVWGKKGSLPLYKNLSKADASILTQLRTGKIGLGAFLYQIGAREKPDCTFCNLGCPEEAYHLICQCDGLLEAREGLKKSLGVDISTFSCYQFLQSLSNKAQAETITKWVRKEELMPFYNLSKELEPD